MRFLIILFLIGCTGPAGLQGQPGPSGQDGAGCIALRMQPNAFWPNGGVYINCGSTTAFLSNGVDGTNGSQGLQGPQGPQGASGPAGVPGTEITPIQFCAGFTPDYPTTFPEVGFLIAGVVYGVYSANDGFLAPLPPGVYSSNGIGASCTFTINIDGSISR